MTDLRHWPRESLLAARRFPAWVCFVLLRLVHQLSRLLPVIRLPRRFWLCGDIDNRTWAPAVKLADRRFGRSMSLPSILEIRIDGNAGTVRPKALTPVAERLFKGYSEFYVNVAFSCGRSRLIHPGVYADPRSPWFNVFVGYYQIDVPHSGWDRPFGYCSDGAGGFALDVEELARLGRADWNYFSNYMYGVPLEALEAIGEGLVGLTPLERTVIGSAGWDHVRVSDVQVASAYVSHLDHQDLHNTHYLLNNIWRAAFGQPYRSNRPEHSFVTTALEAELLVCWTVDDDDHDLRGPVYRTYVFGGTVNQWWAEQEDPARRARHNREFLALQMRSLESLIADQFSHLGFRTPATPAPDRHNAYAAKPEA